MLNFNFENNFVYFYVNSPMSDNKISIFFFHLFVMHSANALSSTVNDILRLFSKFLTKMLQNGVLKTYTFLYTEDYSNIENNYDFIINEMNNLKDVILKLYSDATLTRKDLILDDSFNMLHSNSLDGCVPTNTSANYATRTANSYSLYSTNGIDDSVDENIPFVLANVNTKFCNSMAPNMSSTAENVLCDRLQSQIDFVATELSTTNALKESKHDLNFSSGCNPLTEIVEEGGRVSHNVTFSAYKDNDNSSSMRNNVDYLDGNGASVKINEVDDNMAALDSIKYSDCNNSLYMTLKEAISGDFLQNIKFNSANEDDSGTVAKNMHYNQEVPDYPSCSAPSLHHIDLDLLSNTNDRINHALDRIFDDQFVESDPLLEPECWNVDINLPNSDPVPPDIGLQNNQFNLPSCAKNMESKGANDLVATYQNDPSAAMNSNEHVSLVSSLNDLNESITNNLNNSGCMSNALGNITQEKYSGDFNGDKYFCEHCQFVCNTKLKLKLHLKKQHNVYVNSIHECDECGKTFKDRTILGTHQRIHKEIKPFKCQFCWKTFTQKATLDSHLPLHTGMYKFSCSTCQKKFPTQAKLNFHTKSHEKPEWSCDICSKMFTTRQYLSVHKKSHNKPLPTPDKCLTCIKCNMIFDKNVDLLLHLKEYHPDVNFTCYYTDCNRSYPTYKKLRDHIYKKHTVGKQPSKAGSGKINCQLCGLNFSNKSSYHRHNLLTHCEKIDTENSFGCTQCEKRFVSEAGLREHLDKFHSIAPPQDASCNDLFYEKNVLKGHMNSDFSSHICGPIFSEKSEFLVHPSSHESKNEILFTKHKCDTCQQNYENKMELKQHELDVHNILPKLEELKPFGCSYCDKRFTTRGKCNLHMETHSEDRKYECTKCQKRFYRRDLLKEHLNTHEGYRRYVCGICGLGFSQKSSLKTHELTHNCKEVFTCDRCGKVFLSKQALNFHVKTHDGDFKFACEVCGKKFVRKCHYDLHVLCHSNERPFRCLKCATSYKTSKHLKDHFKKTHQKEADYSTLMNSIYNNDEVMPQQSILNDYIPAISTL